MQTEIPRPNSTSELVFDPYSGPHEQLVNYLSNELIKIASSNPVLIRHQYILGAVLENDQRSSSIQEARGILEGHFEVQPRRSYLPLVQWADAYIALGGTPFWSSSDHINILNSLQNKVNDLRSSITKSIEDGKTGNIPSFYAEMGGYCASGRILGENLWRDEFDGEHCITLTPVIACLGIPQRDSSGEYIQDEEGKIVTEWDTPIPVNPLTPMPIPEGLAHYFVNPSNSYAYVMFSLPDSHFRSVNGDPVDRKLTTEPSTEHLLLVSTA